jgi:hypothetical protein
VSSARAIASRAAPGRAAPRRTAAAPARDAAEREADRFTAAAEARTTQPTVWSYGAISVSPPTEAADEPDARVADAVAGPGRPLDAATRDAMEARFRTDLSAVRVHDDARTAAATRAAGAEGLAVGDDVALAEGLDLASPGSRALLVHELAHVVQQRRGGSGAAVQRKDGAPAAPATSLEGLPEADRKQIQTVTATVTVLGLAEKFATKGTTVSIGLPAGTAAAFDASVDASQQHGLENVAAALSNGHDLTPTPLPPNTTVTLELDPGPPFGKGLYRFTHHAPPAARGGKGAATPAARIIVEALGKATAPPGTKAPPPAKAGGPPAADPVAEKIVRHSFSHSYTDAALDALRAAIDQIPDAQLSTVDGLRFLYTSGSNPKNPDEAGEYNPKTHAVTMYATAFGPSQTLFKGGGTIATDSGTRAIVHEIGHAIDLAPLRKAGEEADKAAKAVDALSTKYPDPKDPKGFQFPRGGPEEKDVKAVLKAQKDAEKTLLATRSLSGTKTVKKKTGDFEDVIGTDVKGSKFREAARKDGGKAVSAYGEKDFQEAFAEAYSMYITSPETLKALRPNVFDYLDKNLPK